MHAANEIERQVTVRGKEDVVRASHQAGTHGNRFLPAPNVHAPQHFPLAVETPFNALFHLTHEGHVIEEFAGKFGLCLDSAVGVNGFKLDGCHDATCTVRASRPKHTSISDF
jgi:hypothetical protein